MQPERAKTWFDRLMISLFVIGIVAPGLVTVFGRYSEVSNQEGRRLASLPAFSSAGFVSGDFQTDFENYLQDHLGLRDQILRASSMVQANAFRKSISDDVIVGEQGWRFFDIDGALYDFVGLYDATPPVVDGWIKGLENKATWLEQLGVQYLLVPIPGKMTVYADYLPDRVREIAGNSRLDAFRQRLASLPSDNPLLEHVVDAQRVLEQARDQEGQPVYFRTDTHWKDIGAYRVYAATMNHARRWLPDLYIVPDTDLREIEKLKYGDIARVSGLAPDYREVSTALEINAQCAPSGYQQVTEFASTAAYRARPKRLPVRSGCPERRYRALVVHDSFGQFLKQFLNESFAEVVYMPSYDVAGMKDFIESFRPDIFIDFRVERRFHLLLQPDDSLAVDPD